MVERSEYYRSEGGAALGQRFFDASVGTLREIERMAGAGSLRTGELCGVDGLRSRRLAGFPRGWFYLERAAHVDVVRLLAYAQDLETILGGTDRGW